MPAHRKPTELLVLSGVFDHNPARRRPIGPKSPGPIGNPPASLAPEAAAAWREVVREAVPGLLTSADRGVVEITALMRARFRTGTAKASEVGLLLRCYAEMGMTPASRSQVTLHPEPSAPASPWDVLRAPPRN